VGSSPRWATARRWRRSGRQPGRVREGVRIDRRTPTRTRPAPCRIATRTVYRTRPARGRRAHWTQIRARPDLERLARADAPQHRGVKLDIDKQFHSLRDLPIGLPPTAPRRLATDATLGGGWPLGRLPRLRRLRRAARTGSSPTPSPEPSHAPPHRCHCRQATKRQRARSLPLARDGGLPHPHGLHPSQAGPMTTLASAGVLRKPTVQPLRRRTPTDRRRGVWCACFAHRRTSVRRGARWQPSAVAMVLAMGRPGGGRPPATAPPRPP
jgi:hypothetical protein